MNVALNGNQSNTQAGSVAYPASVDLTGKSNYLVKIVNNAGMPNFALPTSTDDFAYFILADGDVIGALCAAETPIIKETCRIVLKGTCVPGDELSLADPTTPADAGKVRKRPATSGTWRTLFIAEETGQDGQWVLCRRIPDRVTTI